MKNLSSHSLIHYKTGSLAYFDSFGGLIPCKVIQVAKGDPYNGWAVSITVQLTATRGTYKKGEILKLSSAKCIPRPQIVRRSGMYKIRTNYSWID